MAGKGRGIVHPAALKTGWPKWAIHFFNLHPYRLQMTMIANVNPSGQYIKSPRPFCLQPPGSGFKVHPDHEHTKPIGSSPFTPSGPPHPPVHTLSAYHLMSWWISSHPPRANWVLPASPLLCGTGRGRS